MRKGKYHRWGSYHDFKEGAGGTKDPCDRSFHSTTTHHPPPPTTPSTENHVLRHPLQIDTATLRYPLPGAQTVHTRFPTTAPLASSLTRRALAPPEETGSFLHESSSYFFFCMTSPENRDGHSTRRRTHVDNEMVVGSVISNFYYGRAVVAPSTSFRPSFVRRASSIRRACHVRSRT